MRRFFVDTFYLIALSNHRDQWHRRIAAQANMRLSEEERIDVSPHVLRHTFLRKLVETKGRHYAREASGHQSDRDI